MKQLLFYICTVFFISACASLDTSTHAATEKNQATNEDVNSKNVAGTKLQPLNIIVQNTQLSDIVSGMAEQLLMSFPKDKLSESIVITSLVNLDDYTKADKLSLILSEQFMHQLHIRKFTVIDYKVSESIKILPKGDFALTRDIKRIKPLTDVDRMLVGTISRNAFGAMVNVRILNINQNKIEATASALIPITLLKEQPKKLKQNQYLIRNSKLPNETVSLLLQ
jgi:TolB-like protein